MKKIVVAGCRHYTNYEEAKKYIDHCISIIKDKYTLIFVSGGCSGADCIGERYARENGYEIEIYPAKWEQYGRYAGPKRNEEMSKIGDYFIIFWDGKSKGTKSMISYATKTCKPIKIKMI